MQTDPTPDEIVEYCNTCGGNVVLAWNELLRLMRELLPGGVARHNEKFGLNIPIPSGCNYVQNEAPGDEFQTPAIFIGATVETRATAPRVNQDINHFSIFVLTGMAERKPEIDSSFLLTYLVRGTLKKGQSGWCLPDGRMVWNSINFRGITPLPEKWAKFSGATVTFECDQDGLDLWTPPT